MPNFYSTDFPSASPQNLSLDPNGYTEKMREAVYCVAWVSMRETARLQNQDRAFNNALIYEQYCALRYNQWSKTELYPLAFKCYKSEIVLPESQQVVGNFLHLLRIMALNYITQHATQSSSVQELDNVLKQVFSYAAGKSDPREYFIDVGFIDYFDKLLHLVVVHCHDMQVTLPERVVQYNYVHQPQIISPRSSQLDIASLQQHFSGLALSANANSSLQIDPRTMAQDTSSEELSTPLPRATSALLSRNTPV